jgi:hypothetical protein
MALVNFKTLYSELNGLLKPLPISLCKILINEALTNIYNESDWSFLLKNGYLTIPGLITTGTISVTNGSNQVTISSGLKTVLDAIEIDITKPRVVGRQIRITSPDVIGSRVIYTIDDYRSDTSTITLSEPYFGTTNTTTNFKIFKTLITPYDILLNGNPVTDFKSFEYVADIKEQRKLNLDYLVDQHDHDRRNTGTPFALVPYPPDSSNNPQFELYPQYTSTTDRVYRVKYYAEGIELVNDLDTIPRPLNRSLVMAAAKLQAFEYADANRGIKPEFSKTNWSNLRAMGLSDRSPNGYEYLLQQALRQDEELIPRSFIGDIYSDLPYFRLPSDLRDTLVINF